MSETGSDDASEWLKRAAAIPDGSSPPPLQLGAELSNGRYCIERRIGRGGMGVVYQAWDEFRSERVALKTLLSGAAGSIYRIKHEFRSLLRVRNEHLVRLCDLFEESGRWCFTMEYVPGKTLQTALVGIDVPEIARVARQLVAGIQAIHGAGKVHRDLKPSNIMLTPEGRVVILDFGLVADVIEDGAPGGMFTSTLSGTPAYIAPEQAMGRRATPASDWYAFGVVLFEAFCGRLPFVGDPRSVLLDKRSTDPPSLRHWGPEVPADLDELCRRLLDRHPGARPSPAAIDLVLARHVNPVARGPRMTLSSALSDRGRADGSARSPPVSQLIGRGVERAVLREAYAAAVAGQKPVIVVVAGASGMGKTALCEDFVARLPEALVFSGRCYECESVPYKGFDAIMDDLSQYLSELPEQELDRVLPASGAALGALFPVLRRLSRHMREDGRASEDVHALRTRAFAALVELLCQLRAARPLVIYVDDLQWSDADSTLLLLHLLRSEDAPPFLLIVAHRSEGWENNPCLQPLHQTLPNDPNVVVRQLSVGPLSTQAAVTLLGARGAALLPEIVEQARGNPFLLEEMSRHVLQQVGTASAGVPSLQAALQVRFEALPEEQRTMLELLSLAARPLPEDLIRSAVRKNGWYRSVEELCRARLLRSNLARGEVACYHDLVREAVVAAIEPASVRMYHRTLARALLQRRDPDPEYLAAQLQGAGHPRRAAEQMVRGARRAEATLAFQRAAGLYGGALELSAFDAEERHRLEVSQADAYAAAGLGLQATELYVKALERADSAGAITIRHKAADQCIYSGRMDRGLSLLRPALAASRIWMPSSLLATVVLLFYLRVRLRLRGYAFRSRKVSESTERKIALLQHTGRALANVDGLRAIVLGLQAFLLALDAGHGPAVTSGLVGEVWMGLLFDVSDEQLAVLCARAERACATTGGVEQRATLHGVLASVAFMRPEPDFQAALEQLDQLVAMHRKHLLPAASYQLPWAEFNRAHVLCNLAEFAECARVIPARLDAARARGDVNILPMWAGGLPCLARLATGDVAGAEADLELACQAWSSREMAFQDLSLFGGRVTLHYYQGRTRQAWEAIENCWVRLGGAPLGRTRYARHLVGSARVRAAVALASESKDSAERAALLKFARRFADGRQPRVKLSAALGSTFVHAALACDAGDEDAAVVALRRGSQEVKATPLYHQAALHRLGVLLGGDEGRQLVIAADAFFRRGGALEPERVVTTLLPGCELRR
jgi:tetratricopeptide (TPR) repeat protein